MRALVLGGTGMLGRQVVSEGRRRGHAVLGLSRGQADVTDPGALLAWAREFRPEVVVNCAAMTAVDDCETEEERAFAVNARGVANAAAAARSVGARLVQVSTDYVFDGRAETPYDEDAATAPLSVYGRSKLAGEEEALGGPEGSAGAPGLVVRTSWLFGPGGWNFVLNMLRQLARGADPLRVVDDQVGRPTYTPYLARAIWDLIGPRPEASAAGLVHYGNREPVSWFGFAREIVAAWKPSVQVEPVGTEAFPRPAERPAYSVLAVDRFEGLTGRPVESWRAGLGEYLDHLRA
ncbi:MAG TPA: dTDP-4-dehydrorhamnose reductase, partial [Thermoanaerobaculia bacterium]|nr:dTDP-4-dehydrorhamnose reductase [Thermoanaerobaculia bacterium]